MAEMKTRLTTGTTENYVQQNDSITAAQMDMYNDNASGDHQYAHVPVRPTRSIASPI